MSQAEGPHVEDVGMAAASAAETARQDDSAAAPKGKKGLSFVFDPQPPEGEFSPLYTKAPAAYQASTNAGDLRLYVGGGAINWAFGDLLKREQGLSFGKVSEPYAQLHSKLLAASRSAGSVAKASDSEETSALLRELRLVAAYAWAGDDFEEDVEGFEGATGSVFLDVFEADSRPYGQERNSAMLYVVGPVGKGCTRRGVKPALDAAEFAICVERLGRRSVRAIQSYNDMRLESDRQDLPPLEELRWCLVSGGVYRHPDVSKVEVARATLRGMMQERSADVRVVFSYDEDVFRIACEGQLDWQEYDKIGSITSRKCLDTVRQYAAAAAEEWIATEKVHGANFSFITDGKAVEWAKRTSKLKPGDRFYAVEEQMPRYHPMVLQAFALLKAEMEELTTLRIYGEYFGGWYPGMSSEGISKVMIGIAYAPGHHFIPFDVWAASEAGGHFLDFDKAMALLKQAGFPLVAEVVVRGTFEAVCSIDVEVLRTSVPSRLGLPPITENQLAEGVVIRPSKEPKSGLNVGQAPRLMIKKKAQAFWEATNQSDQATAQAAKVAKLTASSDPSSSEVPKEVLPFLESARNYTSMNRLRAVVSKEGPEVLDPSMSTKLTGLFVKDICESFFLEEDEALSALAAPSLKALKKAIHVQAAQFLANHTAQLRAELQ